MSAAVVGLDLSITATGMAEANGDHCTFGAGKAVGDHRLTRIRSIICQLIERHGCDLVVIEGPVLRSQAAIALGLLHGAVRAALIDFGVPYALVAPATLKKFATGKGTAGKPDMAVALYKRTGLELGDDNQVDACWLRYAGLFALGERPFRCPQLKSRRSTRSNGPSPSATIRRKTDVAGRCANSPGRGRPL